MAKSNGKKINIAVFISGRGSNLRSLIKKYKAILVSVSIFSESSPSDSSFLSMSSSLESLSESVSSAMLPCKDFMVI